MRKQQSNLWRHRRRCGSAVQRTGYGGLVARGIVALWLVLLSGGRLAPAAVWAAPTNGATFDIIWLEGNDCQTPPDEAVIALDYAAGLWGTWISSTVPIAATACWTGNLGGSILGTGGPTYYVRNFPNAPLVNTYYPIALANALSGSDLYFGHGIKLEFNANISWSFATTPPAGDVDFVTIALHELAHGLGFIGNMTVESSIGQCGTTPYPFCPTPYDWHVVDSEGVPLLDYLTPDPRDLAARLRGDANFGGPNTIVANAGVAAKLYAPGYWDISSLSHLDQATFQSTINDLMTPNYGVAARHPGPVTMGILQDIGWLRVDGAPNVVTSGPRIVGVGTATPFTGTLLWDGYTGQPITYTWTTTEQITATHPGLTTTDVVTFTWATPGEKSLTFTATGSDAQASAIRSMLAFAASVSGPTEGKTGRAYTFTADVTLDGYPVTYTWEATRQTPVTSGDNSVTFTWPVSGTQTITVTAVIAGAQTQAVHTIDLEETVYHYIYLPLVQRQF